MMIATVMYCCARARARVCVCVCVLFCSTHDEHEEPQPAPLIRQEQSTVTDMQTLRVSDSSAKHSGTELAN